MKKSKSLTLTRVVGFLATLSIWRAVQNGHFSQLTSQLIVLGAIVMVLPIVWTGRRAVDVKPTIERVLWITSFVHMILMIFFGASIIEAIKLFHVLRGITIPLPVEVGTILLYLTSACLLLTVLNLALSGLGAPFAIVLSKRLATRWMYRWTRNPMVLSMLAALLSAGLYLQSLYFILWLVLLFAPVLIYYLKAYEERELEIRFGAAYLDYKGRTSFLWPRKPTD